MTERPWIPLEHQRGAQTTKLSWAARSPRISTHKVSWGEDLTSWIVSSSEKASLSHPISRPHGHNHSFIQVESTSSNFMVFFLSTQRELNHQFDVILSYLQQIFDSYFFNITSLLAHHLHHLLKYSSQNVKLNHFHLTLGTD